MREGYLHFPMIIEACDAGCDWIAFPESGGLLEIIWRFE